MTPATDDPALTTADAARLLGVSVSTTQKWLELGTLPSWKTPGGHRRVRHSAVLALLSRRHEAVIGDAALPAELFPLEDPGFPVSNDEGTRLRAVARAGLLDTPADPALDRLTWLASEATGMPIALFTVLSSTRQWFKSKVGLDATETPRDWSFCSHAILQDGVFTVEDAAADPRFVGNPLVTGDMHLRFYAGSAVRDDQGAALGALCVIDTQPRQLTGRQAAILRVLSTSVGDLIQARQHAAA
jgi:excisionase family DNA binding protein